MGRFTVADDEQRNRLGRVMKALSSAAAELHVMLAHAESDVEEFTCGDAYKHTNVMLETLGELLMHKDERAQEEPGE